MSIRPLVSIGLFLYNGERFLEAAIESFLNQTFRDFELIISDNCSTDRSDEICRRYAAQDSRIRYYRNERNMGAGWNIRRVYELATGKYFKQAAHDDMIQPDYLRQCVDALEADESLVLAHSLTRVIDENGQFIENYDDGMRTSSLDPVVRARDLLLKGHRCYPIFGLTRLDALHKLPPQGSYAHSDRVLLLQLGLLGRYYEVPEYLFISTRHSNQSVWTMPERTKAKGFRLTRRAGTLPAMEWWDPTKGRKIGFPEWKVAKEFWFSVAHSPLTAWQKTRCYALVLRWMLKYHRRMAKDVLIAADQVLFNFQNRHTIAAQAAPQAQRKDSLPRSKYQWRWILMKVAILAGGLGSRLAEETELKPKPMVEIGGKPILWHIMMHYAHYGLNEFAIALGYKGEVIKKYMLDYCSLNRDLSVSLKTGKVRMNGGAVPDWNVDLVDTGMKTQTGGRIKRLAPYMGNETFMLTWGDGVSDINLDDLLAFHRSHGKLATLTAVRPTARFGHLEMDGNQITEFSEKPQTKEGWINGAFFVLEPEIFDFIDGDNTHFEKEPLERLAGEGQLMAYRHTGFWQCMDTIREKKILETYWESGNAPWQTWEESNASISNGPRGVHRNGISADAVAVRA